MSIVLSQRTEQREKKRKAKEVAPYVSPVLKFTKEEAEYLYRYYSVQLDQLNQSDLEGWQSRPKPTINAKPIVRDLLARLKARIDYLKEHERLVEVFSQ